MPFACWTAAKNLLCVRLDSMGDVLLTVPAIRALKESVPDRRLTLLTSTAGAQAAELIPEIDRVLQYEAPWMKASPSFTDSAREWKLAEALRRERFDGAVIFTVYSQSSLPAALLCSLADIPRRAARCRENPYQLLTDWIVEVEPQRTIRHEVRRQLDLAAALGCKPSHERLSLQIPDGAEEVARRALARCGVDLASPWLLVHPGATAPSRRYPAADFARAADLLAEQEKLQIVFTGVSGEQALIDDIRGLMHFPASSLAGRLDLGQFAAAIRMAPLLIAGNTGPIHIAAAVGTPVVDIYALTNPQHTPWQVPHRVLSFDVPCKYCYKSVCPEGHHACLRQIEPETVVAAAVELLATPSPPRSAPLPAEGGR